MKSKKIIGRICVAVMAVAMIIMCAMPAWAATTRGRNTTDVKSGCKVVGISGSYENPNTATLLNRINAIRKEACDAGNVPDPRNTSRMLTPSDYVPVKWSTELEKMAQLRAAEATIVWGHNRPNGDSSPWSAAYGVRSSAENLSYGTMAQSIEAYYGEKAKYLKDKEFNGSTGHYIVLILPTYNYVGLGSFTQTSTSGVRAAMELTSGSSLSETKAGEYGNYTQEIEMTTDLAAQYEASATDDSSSGNGQQGSGDLVASGNCNSKVTWKLDAAGTLTISGTGTMSWGSSGNAPWWNIRKQIKKVVINRGITDVCTWAFNNAGNLESVQLPNTVTTIGEAAFSHCDQLKKINIPNSVTSIGNEAFWFAGLTELNLPSNLKTIGNWAFEQCDGLVHVTIPEGVTSIGTSAFGWCDNIVDVRVPASVTTLKEYAFCMCDKLETIYFGGTKAQWNKFDGANEYSLRAGIKVVCASGETFFTGQTKKVSAFKLAAYSYTYNGKAIRPAVTVLDQDGRKIDASNYKVTYSNNKNVGTASVKIVLDGKKYTGQKTLTFKINPKGTKLRKISSKARRIRVTWKKQTSKMATSRITGYQVQYSKDKSFKSGSKIKTVKGYKKTSVKIGKLKARKSYYVRVRTYKRVGNATYYSTWSPIKKRGVK